MHRISMNFSLVERDIVYQYTITGVERVNFLFPSLVWSWHAANKATLSTSFRKNRRTRLIHTDVSSQLNRFIIIFKKYLHL